MAQGDPSGDVVVGRVARAHGLSGEVAVDLTTDFPERFRAGVSFFARGPSGPDVRRLVVLSVRWHQGRPLVQFEGVEGRNAAEALRGHELSVPATEVAEKPDGFAYHFELEGCEVVDREGRALGTVTELHEVAGRHLLTISTPGGPRDVPYVEPIVVSVDVGARRVVLDPPGGLLD